MDMINYPAPAGKLYETDHPQPGELYETGGGGMFTYAVVYLHDENTHIPRYSPLIDTHLNFYGEMNLSGNYTDGDLDYIMEGMIAAVLIGSRPVVLCDMDGHGYEAGENDLTPSGQTLVSHLKTLGEVGYITFIDT